MADAPFFDLSGSIESHVATMGAPPIVLSGSVEPQVVFVSAPGFNLPPSLSSTSNPPVVSNVTPTPSMAITVVQAISFDVTDDEGTFTRVIIVADFISLGISEVVH